MLVICGFFYSMPGIETFTLSEGFPRPTARTWARHFIFLAITLVTSTIAGVLFPFGMISSLPEADPQSTSEFLQLLTEMPVRYSMLIGEAVTKLATQADYLTY